MPLRPSDPPGAGGTPAVMRRIEVALVPDPRAPARARRALAEAFDLPPSLLDDARLLVSEVVSNAVRHAGLGDGDRIVLIAHATSFRLRLEVADAGPGFAPPAPGPPASHAAGGRGILLVRRLATRWGAGRDGRHWVVWLELRRRPRVSLVAPVYPPTATRRADRRPAVVTCSPPS